MFSLSLGPADFDAIDQTVILSRGVSLLFPLRTRNDDITLEYNDIVILEFIPSSDAVELIEFYEEENQYFRDMVIVHIIDNDSKSTILF